MKGLLLTALLLFSLPSLASKILNESISVNPYTLPGDSERNQLSLPGIRVHEANDFYGSTDKLVSEAASLNIFGNYAKYFSTSLSYKGRYLQPILRTHNSEDLLPNKIGIYAEWVDVSLNQSITLYQNESWAIKVDGGVSYNDFGQHGFADVYEAVHEAVGSPDESDKFGERTIDNFIGSSMSASFVLPIGNQINLIGSYQVMNSKIFREYAQEGTIIWSVSKDFAMSAKYSFVKQLRSDYYELKEHRQQFIGALRLFKFWTPSIMYVSPYVKGDRYGQWYLSPVSLTYPW